MILDAELGIDLGRFALHDLRLHVEAAETVALLGPNGAGKTTALRALAGLAPLDTGRITLDGSVVDEPASNVWVAPYERSVGVVFQDLLLFPHLSALDNVAFGLRNRHGRRRDARRIAATWLERMALGEVAGARPRELSGGQAQRVALARALATEPSLLLLDEPLTALDVSTRPEVRRELAGHLHDSARGTVLVTHDPLEAMALADRLVVIEDGTVTQAGTAAEVRERPRTRYVADVAGVNFYRGTAGPDGLLLDDGGATIVGAESAVRGRAFAVVHPRSVALHRTRPEGTPRNVWAGTVLHVDPEGDRARVHVHGPVPVTAEVTQAAIAELGLAAGTPVWASAKAGEVTIYPA
jgi:molybdate transport system ATP-binding protein